jgi:uncharacterized protein YyaL (SSP411 family)
MNRLSEETSPYLLQHKDNPVHWHAWNEDAWSRARNENKLVLVSIGYSACHWCHVMEHEVFEDFECAEFMNMHFVCIKVDREEHPDVDSWFMDAVHLMGSQGGWPLNVFTLPDGRPVFGGTYFPKANWMNVLENLQHVFQSDSDSVFQYAEKLRLALNQLNAPQVSNNLLPSMEDVGKLVAEWSKTFDLNHGGSMRAPKFPMPSNWELLLHIGILENNSPALNHVQLTLNCMAMGGIYDQLGGGFARYSVDGEWKVPHFEKMLYDNTQLVSLYAQAYRAFPSVLYGNVVDDTLAFIKREWSSRDSLYYAALDADSDGVEGKYYVWTEGEFEDLLSEDAGMLKRYYGVGSHGFWEHGLSVLCVRHSDESWCANVGLNQNEWQDMLDTGKRKLLHHRQSRNKPATDDKCIASWNAMLVKAFAEASKMKGRKHFLTDAEELIEAMLKHLMHKDGLLLHATTKGKALSGFLLEDQVFFADALIVVYEAGGSERWLLLARELMQRVVLHFSDENSALLLSRKSSAEDVVGKKFEVNDNVIPAANSAACRVFARLARHFPESGFDHRANSMLSEVAHRIDYAPGYSNWLLALMEHLYHPVEVVFTGPDAITQLQSFNETMRPFVLTAASTKNSELTLFKSRGGVDSPIYVCRNRSCDVPVYRVEDIKL